MLHENILAAFQGFVRYDTLETRRNSFSFPTVNWHYVLHPSFVGRMLLMVAESDQLPSRREDIRSSPDQQVKE